LNLIANRRDEFFSALKKVFFDLSNDNLPIYGVPMGKLKDYSTSKKDMKRGVEIVPEENYRLRGEDKFAPKKDFKGILRPAEALGSKAAASRQHRLLPLPLQPYRWWRAVWG